MGRFTVGGDGRPVAELDSAERHIIADLVAQVSELLGGEAQADPFAGLAMETPVPQTPRDPALARLLPDAYKDDPEGAHDFRRFTEDELRAGKVRDAQVVLDALAAATDTAPAVLAPDEVEAWLRALNDVRLSLGARLDVDEDSWEEMEALPEESGRRQSLELYHWLGWLQESLLDCL